MIIVIKKTHPDYKTKELCKLFDLTVSSHYYHANKEKSRENQVIIDNIKRIDAEHHHAYGKRRIKHELAQTGWSVPSKYQHKIILIFSSHNPLLHELSR